MATTETLQSLNLNILTSEQLKNASIGANDIYFVTDDDEWTPVYDSGFTTSEVNSFSGIDVSGYKRLMVVVRCVNSANTSGTGNGAVIFTSEDGTEYAFHNIFSSLLRTGTAVSGAMGIFQVINGFVLCDTALRGINAPNILLDNEGVGVDNLAMTNGGIIKCTKALSKLSVSTANQSATHFYGVGSRVMIWGCKA